MYAMKNPSPMIQPYIRQTSKEYIPYFLPQEVPFSLTHERRVPFLKNLILFMCGLRYKSPMIKSETFIASLFFSLLFTVSTYACERVLSVGVAQWPPYQFVDQNNEVTGSDIDLIKQWSKNISCEIHFIARPWQRLLEEMAKGNVDIMVSASKAKNRQDYATFSAPYRKEYTNLFVLKDKIAKLPITSLSSLKDTPFILGVVRGVYYGKEFEALNNDEKFKSNLRSSQDISIELLLNERYDGYLLETKVGHALIDKLKQQDVIVEHPAIKIETGPIHLMFSKKNVPDHLVDQYNQQITLHLQGQ